MQSPLVMLAVFMLALCIISSNAATAVDVSQDVGDVKPGDDGGKGSAGSFNILEFFEQIKTKTDIAKIFGTLFVKTKE
ncbi:PREDICTED: uncharacterized protein LOC106114212 [Papilio xuthus]|uniref:Uncharacterized protein LOC106114212 n=1 Tax=Papilio xuthus TaxID=66420 RepID=I4DJF0_PAPXU|nr:PREDICTED: uncharacterized protein LOC106114212 [Papilio xuthus]BAM18040.1 unknown secreted protein [Papilio xuthus]